MSINVMNDHPRNLNEDAQFAFELEKQDRVIAENPGHPDDIVNEYNSSELQQRVNKSKPVLDLLHEFRDCPELIRKMDPHDRQTDFDRNEETCKRRSTIDIPDGEKSDSAVVPKLEQLGRFRIEQEIGRGGYGVVVLAYDTELDRKVAIKIPRIETTLSSEMRERFVREARAAAVLSHPGIVAVHEVGHDHGLYFIVSQYVEGVNLAEWLDSHNLPDARQSAATVASLAEAMQHAHQRKVLHRDLKPANILVRHKERDKDHLANRCQIADFGLASIIDQADELTRSDAMVGTPVFMSPEQASGDKQQLGPATDVYGLGVILYQMLTGRPPFDGNDLLKIIAQVRTQDPISPDRRNPETPRDLNAICMKCLEKEPQRRYETAFELQMDLQRFLLGEPVLARPISVWGRLIRWARRHPQTAVMVFAITSLLLLLATGATGAALMLSDSRQDVLDHLEREIKAKDAATKSEDLAIRTLYEARLSESEALTNSGRQGQRQRSLTAIKSAASYVDRLGLSERERARLRSAIVKCSSLIDVEKSQRLDIPRHIRLAIEHDRNSDLYAFTTNDNRVAIRSANDIQKQIDLLPNQKFYLRPFLLFGKQSKHLLMHYKVKQGSGSDVKLSIWKLNGDNKAEASFDALRTDKPSADFNFDDSRVAFVAADGNINLVDLENLELVANIQTATTPTVLRFSNRSNILAAYRHNAIDILDTTGTLEDGKAAVIGVIECPVTINHLEFDASDQKLAAAGEDGRTFIWNLKDRKLDAILSRHGGRVSRVYFHPSGKYISTIGDDNISRIWNVDDSTLVLKSSETGFGQFSKDGKSVESSSLIQNFIDGSEHYEFKMQEGKAERIGVYSDNRVLLVNDNKHIDIFDLQDRRRLASQSILSTQYALTSDGNNLLAGSMFGLFRLPIQQHVNENARILSVGPPEKLSGQHLYGYVSASRDGGKVGIAVRYPVAKRTAIIFDAEQNITTELKPYPRDARWSDMTTDGRFLATGTWHGRNVQIWDTTTGESVQSIECKNAQVCFSPDQTMLAVDDGRRVRLLNTRDWQDVCEPMLTQASTPTSVAFMPGNRILAIMRYKRQAEFVDIDTGKPIVSFDVEEHQTINSFAFTPDGSKFIVGTTTGEVHVWDLGLLDRLFKSNGLSWDIGVSPNSVDALPMEVNLEIDELIRLSRVVAIKSAMDRDALYSDTRNHASENIPLARAIENYVFAMKNLDLSSAPPEFARSLMQHRQAWVDSIPFFKSHDSLRGEMHDLFEQIRASDADAKQQLEQVEKAIRGSWKNVETAAAKYLPEN